MVQLSTLFLLPCLFGAADAWGVDGHTIVAHIANHYLSQEVADIFKDDLLGWDLSNVSNWADNFDHTTAGAWSKGLHFIDYPGHACAFDWATDCKNDYCNAGAIVNYSKQIFNYSKSKEERQIALKFVIHMMGDLHQPLHVSSGDDWGGNKITIPFPHFSAIAPHNTGPSYLNHTNLHAVWDEAIVITDIYESEDTNAKKALQSNPPYVPDYHDWSVLASELQTRMEGSWSASKAAWQKTVTGIRDEASFRKGLTAVAQETAMRGCQYAYNYANGSAVKEGDTLDRDYYLTARPIVEEQLAKGGVRLAQVLEEALAQSRMSQIIV